MKKPSFAVVWQRIVACAGKQFHATRGRSFTYKANGNILNPTHTTRNIPKSDVRNAYLLMPFAGPGIINRICQGPAYIWAILNDQRIVGTSEILASMKRPQYYPLKLFLQLVPKKVSTMTMSFAQIDLILRNALPLAAFERRAWWGNDATHVQAKAWTDAGFNVDKNGVDLNERWVRFRRK